MLLSIWISFDAFLYIFEVFLSLSSVKHITHNQLHTFHAQSWPHVNITTTHRAHSTGWEGISVFVIVGISQHHLNQLLVALERIRQNLNNVVKIANLLVAIGLIIAIFVWI